MQSSPAVRGHFGGAGARKLAWVRFAVLLAVEAEPAWFGRICVKNIGTHVS